MTTVNQARFTIDGTPSEDPTTGDQGYVATLAQTLDCTLEISPSSALSVTFSIFDSTDESSPLASYGAPDLTWVGSGLSSETLASPNGTAQIIMPGAGVASFIIRCTAVMPEGAHTYERLVAIPAVTVPAIRKTVPAEVGQFYARGWSDEQNKMVDAVLGIVAPVGIDSFGSAGTYQGTWVVDAGGAAVNVSAGTGWLRTTASVTGTLVAVTWLASAGIAIPADSTRYIGVEYNGGAPQVVSRVANSFTGLNDFILATVYNEAGTLHILEHEQSTQDGLHGCFSRFFDNYPLSRGERAGGLIVGDAGVRNLTMSAGLLFDGLSRFTISAIDTSAASTFDYYYQDGLGSWTAVAAQTQYSSSHYDDGTGVLHALTAAHYGITWWYLESDGHVVGLYGQGDYASLADAEDATPPASVPGRVTAHGLLIGRTIVLRGAAAATEVESVFSVEFGLTGVTDHNSLGGLQGGGAGEYYHLTAAQTTDLTDGGICTSHLHDLDQCYGAAAATITVDAWDVTWNMTGAFSHVTNLAGCTGTSDGFFVEDGTDYFRLSHKAADTLAATAQLSSFQIDSSDDISLDSVVSSNFTISANSAGAAVLTLRCNQAGAGTGDISVYAADDASVRAVAGTLTLRGMGPVIGTGVEIDADVGGGSLLIGCNAGTNQVSVGGAGARNIFVGHTGATGLTLAAEQIGSSISVNTAGAHQIALSAINIGAGTATISLTADDAVTIDSTAAGVSIDGVADSNFTMTANAVADKTLLISASNAGGGAGFVAFSDGYKAGSTYSTAFVLSDASAEWSTFESNFGEVSLLNALNQCASTAVTLDEAYNASSGASTITVDAGDVTWNGTGAYSFVLGLAGCTGAADGFQITDGADYLSILHAAANQLALTSEFESISLHANRDVTIASATTTVGITTSVGGFTVNTTQFVVDQTTGYIGVGVAVPSVMVALNGEANRIIALERRTAANTDGKNLTLSAGGATVGATDKDGGDLNLASGISTGSGTSGFNFYVYPAGAPGVVDNSPIAMIQGTAALLTLGDTTGASATTIRTGTGAFTCTAGGVFDVNAVGAVTIDSSGGTIGIGVDANAFGINIGTGAAARVITIGNVTGVTGVAINTGTGDFAINTDQLYVDQPTGSVGIHGVTAPTAYLHLGAGTAAATTAPFKFETGVLNTVAEAGAFEYDGSYLYYTDSTPTRHRLGIEGEEGIQILNAATLAFNDFNISTIFVSYTATGACTITIDSDQIAVAGRKFTIKDSGLNAAANNITLATEGAETIEGETDLVMNADGMAITLQSDGTNLWIV